MFTFKKCSKRLKRTVCAALCLIVLSSLLVIPAGAAESDFEGFVNSLFLVNGASIGYGSGFSTPVSGGTQSFPLTSYSLTDFTIAPYRFYIIPDKRLSGYVGIYLSYYLYADSSSVSISTPGIASDSFYLVYTNDDGVETFLRGGTSISSFSVPVVDGRSSSKGYVLKYNGYIDDTMIDVSSLGLRYNWDKYNYVMSSSAPFQPFCCVPSVNFILSDSPSDLGALENVADSIVAQSEIMSAFYGDIMELLNDLYSRLGDIQSVQETANAYFAQLIPLVNSINTNTANIYSLLQTQFQLLRTLIATESGNIQDAIEHQTQDLIAYFDTVLSGSTGNMPEKSDDLESSVGNVSDAESDYQSTATERFDQLAGAFTGFSGGTLGGVTLAATLFSRVWSALGEYSIVYSWPLLLGLCLVVIGRLSRLSGGQSSSVKNRGDSDA